MFRKTISLLMAAALAASVMTGCATRAPQPGEAKPNVPAQKVIRYNMGADPRYLDPALMTDLSAFSAENQMFEGLVRITEKGVGPGMATKWDEQDGGLKYLFTLREGLKWSNGDPLTAEDFVYSWQRALDPRTASEYAYQLYYIKGGEKLNSIKLKTADDKENPNAAKEIEEAMKALGARAIDPKTLEVTLEAPTPYFIQLTAFPTLHPVNKKVVSADKDWATKAASFVSNGPYKLTGWEPKKELTMEKNPNYWDAASVKVDKLVYYMVEEQATALNMWETGQVDIIDSPPAPELARLKKEGKLKSTPSFGTYFYNFNTKAKPFDNPKVRRALAMAIDRKSIVENVVRGGQVPAFAFVAPGSPDDTGKDFRNGREALFKEDVAEAKRLLTEAGYPDGKNFPAVTFLYNTNEGHKAVGEAIIEMWKQNLGITSLKMQNTEWKVVLDKRHKGDYQIARAGWFGDYLDAMTFMDMYVTGGGNNDIFWSNAEYDKLIADTKKTTAQKTRFANMKRAEEILISEMPIMPIYYYVSLYLQKESITGVYRNALGIMDLKGADVK